MSSSTPSSRTAEVTKTRSRGLSSRALRRLVEVEGQVRQEVGLGQDEDVRGREGLGVFLRLVVAFGRREEDEADMLPQLVARRADEVADVLDEQVIDRRGTSGRILGDHLRFEVAGAAGRDLPGRHALGPDALGVALGLDVALDDGHPGLRPQPDGDLLEEGGLARARRAEEVHGQDAAALELRPDVGRDLLVRAEEVVEDDDVFLGHGTIIITESVWIRKVASFPEIEIRKQSAYSDDWRGQFFQKGAKDHQRGSRFSPARSESPSPMSQSYPRIASI